ncbi:MAG TPA: cyanophycin synthetase, partial [Longimicrobiales bacterium]
ERADAELRAERVELDEQGRTGFHWQDRTVRLAFRGRPNARNALLALALGLEWGVGADAAAEALAGVRPPKMRGELHRYGDLTVIADCYNANPASVDAAVDLLVSLPRRGPRIAVLGTMRELGDASAALHRRTAESVADAAVDLIVATGEFVAAFESLAGRLGDRLIVADDPLDAYAPLARRLTGRDVVLLKGSRGVALERLLPRFEEDWGRSADSRHPEGGVRTGGQAATAADGE